MDRSVEMLYGNHGNPGSTLSLICRITAIIFLIFKLVDSMPHHDHWTHLKPKFRSLSHDGYENDDNRIKDHKAGGSVIELQSRDFSLSLKVFNDKEDDQKLIRPYFETDRELVAKAIHDGILMNPKEYEAKNRIKNNDKGSPIAVRFSDEMNPKLFLPTVPDECLDSVICARDDDYPTEEIERLVAENLQDFRQLTPEKDVPIGERTGGTDTTDPCPSDDKIWQPKIARTSIKSNQWFRVVNVQSYTQLLRVAHCVNQESSCFGGPGSFPSGYTPICKQQYSLQSLKVLTPNRTMLAAYFPVPTGCCCHIKSFF